MFNVMIKCAYFCLLLKFVWKISRVLFNPPLLALGLHLLSGFRYYKILSESLKFHGSEFPMSANLIILYYTGTYYSRDC